MNYTTVPSLSHVSQSGLCAFPIFEGFEGEILPSVVEQKLLRSIEKEIIRQSFSKKKHDALLVCGNEQIHHILLVGMGKRGDVRPKDWLFFGGIVARKAKEMKVETIAILVLQNADVQRVVEGIQLGSYTFNKYKSENDDTKHVIREVIFVGEGDMSPFITRGQLFASAVSFARDLVNRSPSETTPSYLADLASQIANGSSMVSCNILSPDEMSDMGGLLGIARGSNQAQKFIHLTYNGGSNKTITLVGKGITFDTGGLSLKTSEGMQTMKLDMSGAATILAIFSVLDQLRPDLAIHGLIPATENMPGPNAVKPGDVVRALNGKTIEILNTDAEGRVILADAMSYAEKHIKSDAIIDVATLTGACMIALGEEVAGLFCNNRELRDALLVNSQHIGEDIWELPLVQSYKEQLKSHVADIKNIGGKYGGAITGALFIEAFVPKGTPWAHLDIAGPSFTEKGNTICPPGGTGFGVRLLLAYLSSI